MKRGYVKPYIEGEEFLPNEYVAVCYYIGCQVNGFDGNGLQHSGATIGSGCGNPHNQVITENPDGTISITEVNTFGQGDLVCTITDSSWGTPGPEKINAGDTVYWTTTDKEGNRKWLHYGVAQVYDAAHPNHS